MVYSGKIIIEEISTPAGDMVLGARDQYLCLCDWKANRHRERNDNRIKRQLGMEYERISPIYEYERISPIFNKVESTAFCTIRKAKQELDEYFAGKRMAFDIPLLMVGTEFQKSIWQTLQNIPYGSTLSYMDIANQVGNPKGVRAVAQAIGANPLSIFVPCHRVVGSNGALTGYAGGIEAKRCLLELEENNK